MLDPDAIQARADAATRGPWTARGFNDEWPVVAATGTIAAVTHYTGNGLPNALFIAAARTDIPALIAELRAARAAHDALYEFHVDLNAHDLTAAAAHRLLRILKVWDEGTPQ